MTLYMYECSKYMFDSTKVDLKIYKLEVREKPKTYSVDDYALIYPKESKGRCFAYFSLVKKSEINVLKGRNCNYKMYVDADTDINRSKFLFEVVSRLNLSIKSIKDDLHEIMDFKDSVLNSDFVNVGVDTYEA